MKKAFVAAAAVLLMAGASFAGLSVEVDLDGQLGNGPDFITVAPSDYIQANIWIIGDAPCCWVFGMFLCNYDHSLEFQGFVFNDPGGGWGSPPVQPPTPEGCITLQGQNFDFDIPMCWPWMIGTVTYHAAVEHSLDELFLGEGSGVLTVSFTTVSFDNNGTVVARIQIGDTGVEETNWGAVKNLFR
jgi:hypothetical protein